MYLSAAYDTVNHILLLIKLYGMTEDAEFTKLIGSMMSNSMGRKSDGTIRRMVYLKGVFSHSCYPMFIKTGQPVHDETRSFIYGDNLCIAKQRSTFELTETILTEALHNYGRILCVQILTKHRHVSSTLRIEKQAGS